MLAVHCMCISRTLFVCQQYILVKFLEPRQESSLKLGIVGVKFFGFVKNQAFPEDESKV